MRTKTRTSERLRLLLFAGGVLIACQLLYYNVIGFSPDVSDVHGYLIWSENLFSLHRAHLPGYPFLIAAIRAASFNFLTPLLSAQLIAAACWMGAGFLAARIADEFEAGARDASGALFLFFPFVGCSVVAYPAIDGVAAVMQLAVMASTLGASSLGFCLTAGFALALHKALWPFVAIMGVVGVAKKKLPVWALLASGVPLLAYYTVGLIAKADPLWILRHNLKYELTNSPSFPLFDAILGSAVLGGTGLLKAGVLFVLLFVAAALLAWTWKYQRVEFALCLVPTIALLAILSPYEAWAALRFGKIVAVPASLWFVRTVSQPGRDRILLTLLFGLFATQVVWAIYVPRYLGR